jgi:ankyrin repeat protein
VRLLLAHKVNVNARELNGYTPLMLAVSGGHVAVAKLLIAAGADVHARDDDGNTVLKMAGQRGEMIEVLRAAGARG